jgi:hypothetical protein
MLTKDTLLLHKDYLQNIFDNDKLTMEEAIYLISRHQGKGFTSFFPIHIKTSLENKGYLSINNTLTSLATSYLNQIIDSAPVTNEDIKLEEDFNRFWQAFPSTDKVHHFPGTRSLKDNKQRCKSEFNSLISQGYTAEEIITGIENQVATLKTQSITENKLKYIKNSLRWLKDHDFEVWKSDKPTNNSINFDMDVF